MNSLSLAPFSTTLEPSVPDQIEILAAATQIVTKYSLMNYNAEKFMWVHE